MNFNSEFNSPILPDETLKSNEQEIKAILQQIYVALCEKGYDPARQIAGYILSEDPVYITNWKNARGLIGHINRDDLLIALINHYLDDFKK